MRSCRVNPHQENGVILPDRGDRLAAGDRPGQADQLRGILVEELGDGVVGAGSVDGRLLRGSVE